MPRRQFNRRGYAAALGGLPRGHLFPERCEPGPGGPRADRQRAARRPQRLLRRLVSVGGPLAAPQHRPRGQLPGVLEGPSGRLRPFPPRPFARPKARPSVGLATRNAGRPTGPRNQVDLRSEESSRHRHRTGSPCVCPTASSRSSRSTPPGATTAMVSWPSPPVRGRARGTVAAATCSSGACSCTTVIWEWVDPDIRFSPPVGDVTRFELDFLEGLAGDDGVLSAPVYFRLPVLQSRVVLWPGTVASGLLNLATGEVSQLDFKMVYLNSALDILRRVNPGWPSCADQFPGVLRLGPSAISSRGPTGSSTSPSPGRRSSPSACSSVLCGSPSPSGVAARRRQAYRGRGPRCIRSST